MKRLGENNLAMIAARVKADYIPKSDTVQAQAVGVDTTPTEGSGNLITSGGVYDAINTVTARDILIYSDGKIYNWHKIAEMVNPNGIIGSVTGHINGISEFLEAFRFSDAYESVTYKFLDPSQRGVVYDCVVYRQSEGVYDIRVPSVENAGPKVHFFANAPASGDYLSLRIYVSNDDVTFYIKED